MIPPETAEELKDLKANMQDTQPVGSLLNCCCTLDQVIYLVLYLNLTGSI